MKPSATILLYSVNTQLAFHINEYFYGQHFVWCSPVYDTGKLDSLSFYKKIPPSSNPLTIYNRCKQDVVGGDLHSNYIIQNKVGIKNGAIQMLAAGKIDTDDFIRINKITDSALINEFSPMLYLIPRILVKKRLKQVAVDDAANPLSTEYQITDLK